MPVMIFFFQHSVNFQSPWQLYFFSHANVIHEYVSLQGINIIITTILHMDISIFTFSPPVSLVGSGYAP